MKLKIKLTIIGVIIVAGVFMFMPNTKDLVPELPDVFDSVKTDLSVLQKDTVNHVEDGVTDSIDTVSNKIDDIKESSEQLIVQEISDSLVIPTSFEDVNIFDENKETPEEEINVKRKSTGKAGASVSPKIITTPETQTISYETLSLITEKQSDNNVMIKYEDTSGKTISVTVTMRNDDMTIFTGQFFSSSFETNVLDAAETSHFIDMVVEHEEHGMISASAFNPAGNTDAEITGAFKSG